MKTKTILFILIIPFYLFGQTWDYPIKPGSKEWQQFKSIEDMYVACQIPEKVLTDICTDSLAQLCLNYPAPLILLFFNSPQIAFDNFYANFNGIRELLNRKDAGHSLLERYAIMNFKDFNPLWTAEKQGDYTFKYQFVETILAQQQVLATLDDKGQKLLLKEAMNKMDQKLSRNDLFGGNSLNINLWVITKILHKQNKLQTKFSNQLEIEKSLKTGQLVDYDLLTIYKQAKNYLYE